MLHHMKLQPQPFSKIRSGQKTIELRLWDEKRQQLTIDDIIEFQNTENRSQRIQARIIALHRFDTFEDLYRNLPPENFGYSPDEKETASPRDMDRYYSPEAQEKWGVVGIELELLSCYTRASREKTSRYLSLLLRHKPEAAGLTLDEHGWADVEELIRCVSKTRFLDRAFLEEIVDSDSKQRYSFSPDKKKIRANQGHSVSVDVELEQQIPPEYLWHGTGIKYVESILQTGLIPKTRLHVHLSSEYATAVNVGSRHGKPFVFRVSSGRMHADGFVFYRSANGVWLTDHVPAEYLESQASP